MAKAKRADAPLLVWDGECDFCRAWIERWRARTGDRVAYATYQQVAAKFPERPLERFRRAVQLREPDGTWYEGAEAVFRSLTYAPHGGVGWWLYRFLPGFAPLSRAAYGWIATHRSAALRWTRLLWGRNLVPTGESRAVWLFLRLLGAVYLAAFLSLLPQVVGLYGTQGIHPAAELFARAREQGSAAVYWAIPSVLWFSASDVALQVVCVAGVLFSTLLLVGLFPALAALGAWAMYLSLTAVGTTFLWFQWDSLLLETGFIALFLAPWRRWSTPDSDRPRPVALWLARWLLFRLVIASAAVKLTSGDPTWHNLTALQFHYLTQPIPMPTSWYLYQLPAWFHRVSVLGLFAIEWVAPFLLLGPRGIRLLGVTAIVLLQVAILATGNYGFFNPLTIALCVCWLDDRVLGKRTAAVHTERRLPAWRLWGVRAATAVLFLLSVPPLLAALLPRMRWPRPIVVAEQMVSPLRIANGYGLFAIMTTRRPEITLEGSRDGREWLAYEFRDKPGDVRRAPPVLGTHMPRLDWQMWFAASSGVRDAPWFLYFCEKLLQGSRPVSGLLRRDPFANEPPRYLRARLADYRFTTPLERRTTGDWWKATDLGLYCPPLTLVGGRVALAPLDSLPR